MPRRNWPKATPQKPKAPVIPSPAPVRAAAPQHRSIEDIRRDIANSPAQALPALQAELIAALDAQRQEG
jgi:hypothetical protein